MSMLINYVKSFARNDEGQDLLEYALLVALIALVAILAVTQAGQRCQPDLRRHRRRARRHGVSGRTTERRAGRSAPGPASSRKREA